MRKLILAVLVVVVVALVAFFAFSATSWPKSTGSQVDLQFFSFHPGTLTVSVGTTVIWTDKDWIGMHNVIGNGWSSDNMAHGDTFSYTFTQAGTYSYKCSHHPWMKGTIIVQ
jgi:plastocyanin